MERLTKEMCEAMMFPDTVEEFMEQYKVYSNGTAYVPIFRMKQWFEHCEDEKKRLIGKMRLYSFLWNHLPKSELDMLLQMYREQDGDGA